MSLAEQIEAAIKREVPRYSAGHIDQSFEDLGIDSFGLLELRASIEQVLGHPIADETWVTLDTPRQLMEIDGPGGFVAPAKAVAYARKLTVDMPQMALGGLSESWLFKEIGDVHWRMITDGLQAPSSALVDGLGQRLYATFTRLRIEASAPLSKVEENQEIGVSGAIRRYGAGLFFSDIEVSGKIGIKAFVMSSFTKRGAPGSNTQLLKGQPNIPPDCSIPEITEMPLFGGGYRQRRASPPTDAIFECDYDILPYHDINGVGLLYFAAYPVISDLCELRYVGEGNSWALRTSTVSRDVYYFANSDAHDSLIYRVHARRDEPGFVEIESSISRRSDGALMAYLITRKALLDG